MRQVLISGTIRLMMKYGIMYEQGEILIIPAPFTDLTSQKKPPVLVLSNNNYNIMSDDIIVAAITLEECAW